MEIEKNIAAAVVRGIKALYGQEVPLETVQLQKTKKEFAGHLTLVVFPFLKISRGQGIPEPHGGPGGMDCIAR